MAMDDSFILDYLGSPQPLGSKRLVSLPSSSGGGGTSTPSVTGTPFNPRLGGFGPATMTEGEGTSPGALNYALRALGLGQNAVMAARRLMGGDQSASAVTPASGAPQFTGSFTDPNFPGMTFPTRGEPPLSLGGAPGEVPSGFTVVEGANGPELVSAVGSEGTVAGEGTGIATAGAQAGADLATSAFSGLATTGGSTAGNIAGGIATAYGMAQEAQSGHPAWQQALNDAFRLIGYLYGPAGAIAAQFAIQDLNRVAPSIEQGDIKPALVNAIPGVAPIQDIGEWFGKDVFGLEPSPRRTVNLPGLTKPLNQTSGGAKTTMASYNQGIAGAHSFTTALRGVKSPDDLVSVLNGPFAPNGEFVINATTSKGEGLSNVARNANYQRGFTAADLADPGVLQSIEVYSGVTGAPARQDSLTSALRQAIMQAAPTPTMPAAPTPTMPAAPTPTTPAAPMGPSGALGFAQDLIPQGT